ncbi:MAG: hypothetical protein H7232_08550 [Aeromicrobium sp.]|nr:hypothetical protein [Burkholderiales bacterium]
MTKFATARPARVLGDFDDVADQMKGSFWGDVAREAASGSDRGLVQTAATTLESLLKSLLVSDPGPVDPAMRALINPGGPLCHRNDLVDYLEKNGFIGDKPSLAAIRSLFACADIFFQWDGGDLDDGAIATLNPLFSYFQDPDIQSPREGGATLFTGDGGSSRAPSSSASVIERRG